MKLAYYSFLLFILLLAAGIRYVHTIQTNIANEAYENCSLECWPWHGKSAFFVIPESE